MNPRIQTVLDNALAEVRALLLEEASEAVRAALGDGGAIGAGRRTAPAAKAAAPSKAPSKAAKPAKRPKGAKRSQEEIAEMTASVESAIKRAKDGLRSEQLSAELGISTADLVLPLQRLLEAKKIKGVGVRRGRRYLAR